MPPFEKCLKKNKEHAAYFNVSSLKWQKKEKEKIFIFQRDIFELNIAIIEWRKGSSFTFIAKRKIYYYSQKSLCTYLNTNFVSKITTASPINKLTLHQTRVNHGTPLDSAIG